MDWNFQETLIMVLLGSLFFKEQMMAFFAKRFGYAKETSEEKLDTVKTEVSLIAGNHLAHVQEDLHELKQSHRDFRETQLKQCTKLESIEDSLKDIVRNGIRIRT